MDPLDDRLLREVMNLPPEARAALAGALLESLELEEGEHAPDADVEAAWAVEIHERWQEFRDGRGKTVPWAEVRRKLFDG